MNRLKHVFALVPDCQTPPNYLHLAWRRHFYEGLRPHVETLVIPHELDFRWARQGHGIDLAPFAAERGRCSEQLLERIKAAHQRQGLDAVLTYCFAFDLELEVVQETIKLGVPWINFFCDSTHMFEKVEPLARLVSLNWFPESAALPSYQSLGVPFLCAPYAWSPEWLPDLTNRSVAREVAFIGFPSSNRITQLGLLRWRGCPVHVRGRGWVDAAHPPFHNPIPLRKRLRSALAAPHLLEKVLRRLVWPSVRALASGPLKDEEFGEYVRESLILLGLNQGRDARGNLVSYLKFRDMEFPGYGCCYLTEHNEDIPRVFEVGEEILTFQSIAEAAAQIRRLRRDPGLARRLGAAGRRRVLDEHHWGVRLRQLAERLG